MSVEEVPQEARDAELEVLKQGDELKGKPPEIQEKIAQGRLDKWLKENVLLEQQHVNTDKHEGRTIEEIRTQMSAKTGENVVIRRFALLPDRAVASDRAVGYFLDRCLTSPSKTAGRPSRGSC